MSRGLLLFGPEDKTAPPVDLSPPWKEAIARAAGGTTGASMDVPPALRAATEGLLKALSGVDFGNGTNVKPENKGRWDWVLHIHEGPSVARTARIVQTLAPKSYSQVWREDRGGSGRQDLSSYGVALTGGFRFMDDETRDVALVARTGPFVPVRAGEPPRLWPTRAEHGLSMLPLVEPTAEELAWVLGDPGGPRLWLDGLPFTLPPPNTPVAWAKGWPNVRTVAWVHRVSLGPLHGVQATETDTAQIHRLFPIPVAAAVLDAASRYPLPRLS